MEVYFDSNDVIVSKTNLKGHLTYVNDVFYEIAGYTTEELIGKPHSIIRHEDMPRCVFQLLWEKVMMGDEIFAYVVNKCKNGDHYWVFAHVTPSFDKSGSIIGYHSNRRTPSVEVIQDKIIPLYKELISIEKSASDRKTGQANSYAHLTKMLTDAGLSYEEFVFSLNDKRNK